MLRLSQLEHLSWLYGGNVKPYIFLREREGVFTAPSSCQSISEWFPMEPIILNPLRMADVPFANGILSLEHKAFHMAQMETSRWVFYDCGLMPGIVVGLAWKTSELPVVLRSVLDVDEELDWTPISLFIMVPSMVSGEWVAHNLCSVNTLLEKKDRYYGLGFLTKAFGLWYGNVDTCCGVTQWKSPAMKLHSYYGDMEILTAYTPIHNYPKTLTYRSKINMGYWEHFFTEKPYDGFERRFSPLDFGIDPQSESSCIELQNRIERGEGPFFLFSSDVRKWSLGERLPIYKPFL